MTPEEARNVLERHIPVSETCRAWNTTGSHLLEPEEKNRVVLELEEVLLFEYKFIPNCTENYLLTYAAMDGWDAERWNREHVGRIVEKHTLVRRSDAERRAMCLEHLGFDPGVWL